MALGALAWCPCLRSLLLMCGRSTPACGDTLSTCGGGGKDQPSAWQWGGSTQAGREGMGSSPRKSSLLLRGHPVEGQASTIARTPVTVTAEHVALFQVSKEGVSYHVPAENSAMFSVDKEGFGGFYFCK